MNPIVQSIDEPEHHGDLALGALGGPRVDVGARAAVRGQAGVAASLLAPCRSAAWLAAGSVAQCLTRSSSAFGPAIQTATRDERAEADDPAEQALGDRAERAEAEPARVRLAPRACSMYAMIACLFSGGSVVSGKTACSAGR